MLIIRLEQSEENVHGGRDMTPRQAVRILMLSPIYFRLTTIERWWLVREYCKSMNRKSLAVR